MSKKMLVEYGQQRRGLRERKKAKTRAAIQLQALRLFQEQGYAATTVEQIAAAVEVSPSTFFRYFPTKEDVVLYDDLDPLFFAAFEAQPPELTPIQAMRGALHLVFAGLSGEEMEQQQVRTELILAVPELRMRMLDQFANLVDLLAELVGRRVGRSANDFKVRAFSGALMGTLLAPILADLQGTLRDYIAQMEDSLDFLEAGLPL
jgi:AcrR family transcriptional regulator